MTIKQYRLVLNGPLMPDGLTIVSQQTLHADRVILGPVFAEFYLVNNDEEMLVAAYANSTVVDITVVNPDVTA